MMVAIRSSVSAPSSVSFTAFISGQLKRDTAFCEQLPFCYVFSYAFLTNVTCPQQDGRWSCDGWGVEVGVWGVGARGEEEGGGDGGGDSRFKITLLSHQRN